MAGGLTLCRLCLQPYAHEEQNREARNRTPYEVITGRKADLSNLRIFGTRVKVLRPPKYRKTKVGPKTWCVIHLGYSPGDAYAAYIHKLGRLFVSKDVTFIEKL